MNIGFTGTRKGMTDRQKEELGNMFWVWSRNEPKEIKFHHGGCVGADAQAHLIATTYNMTTVIHPPTNDKHQAFGTAAGAYMVPDELRDPKPYLDRNHDIVDECDVLIACPKQETEIRRSGTWATIRHARRTGKPLIILHPEGGLIR